MTWPLLVFMWLFVGFLVITMFFATVMMALVIRDEWRNGK